VTETLRPKKRQRSFTPTRRDEALFGDLYNVRIAHTAQLAGRFWPEAGTVYFPAIDPTAKDPDKQGGRRGQVLPRVPSPESCARRLRTLRANRALVSRNHPDPGISSTIWMLSRTFFRREADDLKLYGEPYPGWLKARTQHLLDTNDLYFALAGDLDAILGPGHGPRASWRWLDERRAYDRYEVLEGGGLKTRYHQPDAEVRFGDRLFIIERQTRRARETAEALRKKVLDHRARATYELVAREGRNEPPLRPCIVFACDTERDLRYAREAADEVGDDALLEVFIGTVEEAASYVADEALRLS
jgi:hypothetical protein